MVSRRIATSLYTAAVLGLAPLVLAHGSDHAGSDMQMGNMGHGMTMNHTASPEDLTSEAVQFAPTYFRYGEYSNWMWGHIFMMVLSWCVILPLGVMLSIARSRFTLPVQTAFLATNAVGVACSVIYRSRVPDLYEHNVHYRMGWLFTWAALAWVLMGVVNLMTQGKNEQSAQRPTMSAATMQYHDRLMQQKKLAQSSRWSRDSGIGAERNSSSLYGSSSGSPSSDSEDVRSDVQLHNTYTPPMEEEIEAEEEKQGFLHNARMNRFLSASAPRTAGSKLLSINKYAHLFLERSMIILGWFALTTGGIVFGGIMQGDSMLNGLAHFIKGSIFFWYGLLTLGRWAGSFADFGWAWNVKPPVELVGNFRVWVPTGEFTESFVIALYGITNVWLEHLSSDDGVWHANDLEHVSITLLFFGGGVLGMLVESHSLRSLLQSSLFLTKENDEFSPAANDVERWSQPDHYTVPLNPLPGLVIMLLGLMMSSHTQHSMVSSMLHKQWGTLFIGFALARGFTYLLIYIKPYSSYLPSRPPTELISAFCLTSGGLMFIASSSDIVEVLEYNDLDAMFLFTVGMGLTGFIMAWTIILLAILGWAQRKENPAFFRKLAEAEKGRSLSTASATTLCA